MAVDIGVPGAVIEQRRINRRQQGMGILLRHLHGPSGPNDYQIRLSIHLRSRRIPDRRKLLDGVFFGTE